MCQSEPSPLSHYLLVELFALSVEQEYSECISNVLVCDNGIDLGTDKHDGHTTVQPEHADNDCCKAAIEGKACRTVVDVNGIDVRKSPPADGTYDSTRKLGKEF